MVSFRSLLAAAPLLAAALAQNIAFTSTPAVVQTGESYNVTWAGGDGTGVTLTLRRGNPQDLTTISTLADSVLDYYYVWQVSTSLESGDDYALQITQGQSDINYSGLFTVEGGSSSGSNATTTTATPSNGTASITSVGSASGTGTALSRNSTFSTATLTSSSSDATFGSATSTRSSTSRTASSSAEATSAPSNDASIKTGSSVALILGIVAAIMLH